MGIQDQRKDVEMMKNTAECARSAVMLDGEIPNYVYSLQGVAQGL